MVTSSMFVMIFCAELFLLLVRSRDIKVILKPASQRAPAEQREVDRGLVRAVVLDVVAFVPASVTLVYLSIRPVLLHSSWIAGLLGGATELRVAFDSILGIVSYGFPFAAVRRIVVRMALRMLSEFAAVADRSQVEHDA